MRWDFGISVGSKSLLDCNSNFPSLRRLSVAKMAFGSISCKDLAYRLLHAADAASLNSLFFVGPIRQWPKILNTGCRSSHGRGILPSFTSLSFSDSVVPEIPFSWTPPSLYISPFWPAHTTQNSQKSTLDPTGICDILL